MNKKVIFTAFILPIAMGVYWLIAARSATEGFGVIGASIGVMVAIVAAISVGIILFFLRSRQLHWVHGILISFVGMAVGFGLLALLGLYYQLTSPPPLPNDNNESGIVGSVLVDPNCPRSNPACEPKPYSGAIIKITNKATQTATTVVTDEGGNFRTLVPDGTYHVEMVENTGSSCQSEDTKVNGISMSVILICDSAR